MATASARAVRTPLPVLDETLPMFEHASPDCVTLLPTYRCNAACTECCFESNPHIKHRMSRDDLFALIDRIADELPAVRYLVFSGGEVTLLRQDLVDAIGRARTLGLASRIVSNGHWGRTQKSADWWVTKLRDAGLAELNLSTGDEHQMFVPVDDVARAALTAVKAGLVTLITVEGKDRARFRAHELAEHPAIAEILKTPDLLKRFILMTNIWMPFHAGTDVTNDDVEPDRSGCDNVFDNFVVNPYGFVMSCCGLTMEYIPELKVGRIDDGVPLSTTYRSQFRDLLKLWIWLDGTRFIFDLAIARENLPRRLISPHMCAICAQLFKDDELRAVVANLVEENAEQILFRAAVKARVTGRVPRTALTGGTSHG